MDVGSGGEDSFDAMGGIVSDVSRKCANAGRRVRRV